MMRFVTVAACTVAYTILLRDMFAQQSDEIACVMSSSRALLWSLLLWLLVDAARDDDDRDTDCDGEETSR